MKYPNCDLCLGKGAPIFPVLLAHLMRENSLAPDFMTEKILLNFDECMEVDNRFSYPYDLKKNPYAGLALVKV